MSNLMPPGWTAHQTPDGRWYFHHGPTNVTQWHAPPPQSVGAPPPPPPGTYPAHTYQSHAPKPHSHSSHCPPAAAAASAPSSSRYVYRHAVDFKLQEKAFSLSGDDFSVVNVQTGEQTFKVKGNAFSFKDSKSLLDSRGRPLYKMSEALLSLRGRMKIVDPSSGRTVINLRRKGLIPMLGTSTIQAWQGDEEAGAPLYEVKGNLARKDFVIRSGGRKVATVQRKLFTASNFLLGKDTYVIRVQPGNDAALLVFLVVAIDEQYRDDDNSGGGLF